ncbi:MAG: hypothetical protein KBG28_08195 [Kofleriaceae bacterium]|nr:hypothetical protein [Kofleriaceae bacterium]
MTRSAPLLLLVGAVACSGRAGPTLPGPAAARAGASADAAPGADQPDQGEPPPPTSPPPRVDWAAARIDSDAELAAVWRRLVPVALDWDLAVADIPDDATARALAIGLLRAGNFVCTRVHQAPVGCRAGAGAELADVAPTATLDDPCLRRQVALWAIERLSTEDVVALAPTLEQLVRIGPPEPALADAVLEAAIDAPEPVRLRLVAAAKAAGQDRAADDNLGGLSDAAMITAARDWHLDGAVEAIDAGLARPTYLAALTDLRLRPATRLHALTELVSLLDVTATALPRDLEAGLVKGSADPDCGVAMAAAEALASFGKVGHLPRAPASRRPADLLRTLCLLVHAEGPAPLPRGLIAPRGLTVIERVYDPTQLDDAPDDGDGDPRMTRTVTTTPASEVEVVPFDDELVTALAGCRASPCVDPSTGVRFSFGLATVAGRLTLASIERFEGPDRCGEPELPSP